MNKAQRLEFEPVQHEDYVFSITVDGTTLLWWAVILIAVTGAWWFLRRRRSATESDGS